MGYFDATASRSAARWRCCHSGVRGPSTRQQQRPRRALAEAGGEQRRLRQRRHHQLVDVVGVDDEIGQRQLVGGLGQAQHDAVVGVHRLHRDVVALEQPAFDGHRPRSVHRHTERAEDAHPPVADLVAEALDHDGAIIGHRTRCLRLLLQVEQHVVRGQGIERVVGHQRRQRTLGRQRTRLALERTQCATQLEWPAGSIAVPERHLPRLTGSGRDHHPLERDVLDAPGAGAEQEGLARPALVDHLLVELAHARAVGQEDPEQTAIGNGATAHDGQPLAAVARTQRAGNAIPHQARAELVELLTGVAARQQVEHVVQQLVAELGEAGGTAHHRAQLVHRQIGLHRHVRDDLLGQHIEWVAQEAAALDEALAHAPHHHRGLQQVAAMLGVHGALAGLADAVAGTPDALQTSGYSAGRLDLDDEIYRAHVDAQLEAAGGDDGAQLAALELVFDDHSLLASQRPVVRFHQVARDPGGPCCVDACLGSELVEPGREPLGEAATVAEDDGAAVRQHLLQDARVDAGPDAAALALQGGLRRPAAQLVGHLPHRAHVVDGHHHLDFQWLADARVDDGDRAARARCAVDSRAVATQEVRDLFQRPLRGAEADALRRAHGECFEPLEAEHEVRPSFGGGHRVDLVDDDGVHVDQRVAHLAGEHQVQALGRGDEQVDRAPGQCLAILRRGVAGAHGHCGLDERHTEPLGRQPDAHQRRAQVLLDVERQRPQRGDVQHLRARLGIDRRCRRRDQAIEAGKERGEGLAATGGCADQRVLPAADGRPALDLRWRGGGERRGEPLAHGGREALEHRMVGHACRLRQGCDEAALARAGRDR